MENTATCLYSCENDITEKITLMLMWRQELVFGEKKALSERADREMTIQMQRDCKAMLGAHLEFVILNRK